MNLMDQELAGAFWIRYVQQLLVLAEQAADAETLMAECRVRLLEAYLDGEAHMARAHQSWAAGEPETKEMMDLCEASMRTIKQIVAAWKGAPHG